MFIITGSMIRQAISLARSASRRSRAGASLKGTTSVSLAMSAGMPSDIGVAAGCSRSPIASAFGHDREHHRVVVAVVRALDLHDLVAAR